MTHVFRTEYVLPHDLPTMFNVTPSQPGSIEILVTYPAAVAQNNSMLRKLVRVLMVQLMLCYATDCSGEIEGFISPAVLRNLLKNVGEDELGEWVGSFDEISFYPMGDSAWIVFQ